MKTEFKSIRTFVGSQDFDISRAFYLDLGFTEIPIDAKMSYFRVNENMGFYLQDAYVKEWMHNSMVLLEVDDLDAFETELLAKKLPDKYAGIKITPIQYNVWGREIFMHDPSGVLWHFATFNG